MAIADIRQRSSYLLFAVMIGHLILISAQVRSRAGVPILESVTFGAFARVQEWSSSAIGAVTGLWSGYVSLRGVRDENQQLRRQLSDLQVRLQQERALAGQGERLRALLDLRTRAGLETTAAEIVAGSATPDFRVVTINRGRSDGLRTDMAVIAPAGIVGRVVLPASGAAKVQLILDRNAAAAAIVDRSRAQGIVVGTGESELRLEHLAPTADVKAGDTLVTSAIDGIYPKGFTIGTVSRVEDPNLSTRKVWVKPTVDFSTLEEVLVVVAPLPAPPNTEGRE
jgi:rod shape-determining protein MreC